MRKNRERERERGRERERTERLLSLFSFVSLFWREKCDSKSRNVAATSATF